MEADFTLSDQGSICILTPIGEAGETWLSENIGDDAMRWGAGVVIEHRYVDDIIEGIQNDGLTVE